MNRSLRLVPALPLLLVLLAPHASAATEADDPCSRLDVATLPQTADGAQAWFDACRQEHRLPRTADGAAAWLR